ncbi:MAG TPA: hypothetical protein VGG49_08275 [Steroidobacteraceae bacterium]|jgi:hypothetical protein
MPTSAPRRVVTGHDRTGKSIVLFDGPLRQGDVVVQRGTDHAWENRSSHYCRSL